jgi:hypothetical protein
MSIVDTLKSNILEEQILLKSARKRLWDHDSIVGRVNMSGMPFTDYDKYVEDVIIIDHHKIKVFRYIEERLSGYYQYFYYPSNLKFDNGQDILFQIYVPYDMVDAKEDFFTTDIIERRFLKIKHLKEKIS